MSDRTGQRHSRVADRISTAIEGLNWLDGLADRISSAVPDSVRTARVRDLASGTMLGHPAHPAAVTVPTSALLSASVLDVIGGPATHPARRRLIALGMLASLPAALAGWSDWLDTEGAERRVGLVHAAANATAIALYASSWSARRRNRHARGTALALAGAGLLGGAGWLGGHLAYALGVGVDTTAFQHMSEDWIDVAAATALTRAGDAVCGNAAGTPIMIVQTEVRLTAIADRCTHRGAPLHEGDIADGCVTCPWHNSVFDLHSGRVKRGPATRPQPVFEARVVDGRIQVRRAENRSLRTNPV